MVKIAAGCPLIRAEARKVPYSTLSGDSEDYQLVIQWMVPDAPQPIYAMIRAGESRATALRSIMFSMVHQLAVDNTHETKPPTTEELDRLEALYTGLRTLES